MSFHSTIGVLKAARSLGKSNSSLNNRTPADASMRADIVI